MQRRLAVWLLVCLVTCFCSEAQSPAGKTEQWRIDRLDAVASSYSKDNAFMGSVLVAEGDRILLNKGYGLASLEWNVPNAPDVKFRIGSISKQFTASLVLLLQQDGKLNIDDPVKKYLPDSPKAWEKITLAELLGHTSGITDIFGLKGFKEWGSYPRTSAELLAFFRDKPLDFEPGSRFSYSNSGYVVLGAVIEKVSGKKYGQMLEEKILKPLGMSDTGIDTDELVLAKRAEGYSPGEQGLAVDPWGSLAAFWPDTLYSTTGDLLKWQRALFGGHVLLPDSLERMTTPGNGGYGLAVFVSERDGLKVLDHDGQLAGFKASVSYVPKKKIAVIVLGNVYGAAVDRISWQLENVMFGSPVVLASEQEAFPIAKSELAKFSGMYEISPEFSIAIAESENGLTAKVGRFPVMPLTSLIYLGLVDGHPRFFSRVYGSEFEFVADSAGTYSTMVYHEGWSDFSGNRR